MEYKIKITGSGSKGEIIQALKDLAENIKKTDLEDSVTHTFEDPTLCAEVDEKEEEDEEI